MGTSTSVVAAAKAIGEREHAVLLALAEHKFFSTDQIQTLFCDSSRTTQRVLSQLRRDGLISSFEWRSSSRRRDANRHLLTPAGLNLVASLRGCRVAELGKIPTDKNAVERIIRHRAGVNRFFCDLVALTLQRQDYGLESWRDEHKLITPFGEVQPDSFGRLVYPAGAVEFYFEYDLGTEHRRVLIDKLANYLRIASTWDSLDDQAFPNVLFVTTKDDRELEFLRAALRAVRELKLERSTSARLPFYCTTVARLRKHGQLGPVWRDMFRRGDRLRLDQLSSIDAEPYHLGDCLGRRWRMNPIRSINRTPSIADETATGSRARP